MMRFKLRFYFRQNWLKNVIVNVYKGESGAIEDGSYWCLNLLYQTIIKVRERLTGEKMSIHAMQLLCQCGRQCPLIALAELCDLKISWDISFTLAGFKSYHSVIICGSCLEMCVMLCWQVDRIHDQATHRVSDSKFSKVLNISQEMTRSFKRWVSFSLIYHLKCVLASLGRCWKLRLVASWTVETTSTNTPHTDGKNVIKFGENMKLLSSQSLLRSVQHFADALTDTLCVAL